MPKRLPVRGRGYRVGTTWRERNNLYGAEELVVAVQRASAKIHFRWRRAQLGVGDLSPISGGRSPWHASHQSGRDIDLIFYSRDEEGKLLAPPDLEMIHYDRRGRAFKPRYVRSIAEENWEKRRFDEERNWYLVEALLLDPDIRIQWIFVSYGLKARLLRWARQHDRPEWMIEYARLVLQQPGRSARHDDHFHVRIYCSRRDRLYGCEDSGVIWKHEKKTFKYLGYERYRPLSSKSPPPFMFMPVA